MDIRTLAVATLLAGTAAPAAAQRPVFHGGHSHEPTTGGQANPRLHVNPRWRECSFQLDSALTQTAWHQFTGEAGVVIYFKPLVDARPMGRGKFEVSLLQWTTGIDDRDDAWNDTFVHPDSTHWLFEGNGLKFPGITARAGLTDRTDASVYFTKNPNANYGFWGVQLQRNLVDNPGSNWAVATRVSYSALFGPEDMAFGVAGADLLASRRYALLGVGVSPYAGVTATFTRAHEKSAVVDLKDEGVFGAQATAGAVAELSFARVAFEYSLARVPSMSLKIGLSR